MTECDNTHDKLLFYLTIILLAAGLLLRITSLTYGSLEYDEIWTLCNYVPGPWLNIFTDLATPNNHPLHTLLAKISLGIFGESTAALRLPALLAGCALIPLIWYTIHKITPCRGAGLISVAWSSFYGYSLYYSQAARGYSMQMFFVAATFLAMWLLYQKTDSIKYAVLLTVCAICCCFTITSGLIYVCALAGAFAICYLMQKKDKGYALFHKKYRFFRFAGGAFLLVALLWYGLNFSKIRQGQQQFGVTLDSISAIAQFLYNTAKDLFLYPLLAVCIAGACVKNQYRRFSVFSLIFTALIVLSAFATKAGPSRVYLGVYPILTVTAALVLSGWIEKYGKTPQIRLLLYVLCILPPILTFQKEWDRVIPPDWGIISSQLRKEIPSDMLIAYTPPDSYPVRYNDPQSILDQLERINQVNIRGLLVINAKKPVGSHHLTASNTFFAEKCNKSKQTIQLNNSVSCYLYPLQPVTAASKTYKQTLLLVIGNTPQTTYEMLFNTYICKKDVDWLLLNFWLREDQYNAINNITYINRIYSLNEAQYEADHYLEITRLSDGKFRFYTFK